MSCRLWSKVLFSAVLLSLAIPSGWAQKVSSAKAKDTGPKYDVTNEVRIKGVIEDMREVPDFEGTEFVLKTDTGSVLVHVAPAAFLKEIEASFNKGDEVQVLGAKAPDSTDGEVLAREITVGTNVVTLRDDKGIPVWAGWKFPGK